MAYNGSIFPASPVMDVLWQTLIEWIFGLLILIGVVVFGASKTPTRHD